MESGSGSATFHVLTWVAGQGTVENPATPGSGGSSLLSVTYANLANNTRSSPFVDYAEDAAYLGADNGILYKIKPVFGGGTPTLVGAITVNFLGAQLTAPARDPFTGIVFISDGTSVKAYNSDLTNTLGTVTPSASGGISDAPILDVSYRFVYAFTKDKAGNSAAAAVQIPYTASSPVFGTPVYGGVGVGGGNPLHLGAFDDKYFTTGPSAGTLYVCGNQAGSYPGSPGLYAFAFNGGGAMNPTAVLNNDINLGRAAGQCSPMTEFYNPNHVGPPDTRDKFFVGLTGDNWIQMWNITTRITQTWITPSAGARASGGTSGIVVDNYSTQPQASSIYFGTLGTAESPCSTNKVCAVKMMQLNLQ